ncbi:hypothetical protein [Paraburkholderia aromaticivorans]|uniref:Uncharacterized protein n=1 Tax=Paraburkholderia aromaticivorans TaxID=2026199 RepID=A0A248VFG4_9BURK|nr:hypothetical protein [Paraburkholderia aromaticivorans]ASV97584.1 hypothetical protein CJU94_05045 [Paraburkholderia aromaticivorans]
MAHDPLMQQVHTILVRVVYFVAFALVQSVLLWVACWQQLGDSWLDALIRLSGVWPLSPGSINSLLAMLIVWASVLQTTILFLIIGRWWARKTNVMHRRGSRFIDERGG